MRWFLDMCIILYYAGEGDKPDFNKKTRRFVQEKNENKFLLCYYVRDINLPKWLERQKIILREITRKLQNNFYILYTSLESSKLTSQDKKKLTKLLILSQSFANDDEKIDKLTKIFSELERRINYFLTNYIDEFVIPVVEIDFELKSHIFTFLNLGSFIKNDSDAKTIASAIQENNNQNLIILTADKSDWNKELLQEVHNHYNLKKKYPKLPDINYLQDL